MKRIKEIYISENNTVLSQKLNLIKVLSVIESDSCIVMVVITDDSAKEVTIEYICTTNEYINDLFTEDDYSGSVSIKSEYYGVLSHQIYHVFASIKQDI